MYIPLHVNPVIAIWGFETRLNTRCGIVFINLRQEPQVLAREVWTGFDLSGVIRLLRNPQQDIPDILKHLPSWGNPIPPLRSL